jgi:hypothetical protein
MRWSREGEFSRRKEDGGGGDGETDGDSGGDGLYIELWSQRSSWRARGDHCGRGGRMEGRGSGQRDVGGSPAPMPRAAGA